MKSARFLSTGLISAFLFLTLPTFADEDPMHPNLEGSYAGNLVQVDKLASVNLFNGGLNLTLPLHSLAVSDSLNLGYSLSYSMNIWNLKRTPLSGGAIHTDASLKDDFTAGTGWKISLPRLVEPDTDLDTPTPQCGWSLDTGGGMESLFHNSLYRQNQNPNQGCPDDASGPGPGGYRYSQSGSFLRAKINGSGATQCDGASKCTVEYPTGEKHTFTNHKLSKIESALGATVTVNHPGSGTGDVTYTDQHGRVQRLTFGNETGCTEPQLTRAEFEPPPFSGQ